MAVVIVSVQNLIDTLPRAIDAVRGGTSAILEVRLEGSWEKPAKI